MRRISLRLLFLGNSNCMPFNYAYLIKELGHDVHFYVDAKPSEPLHRPEAYFSDISFPYPNWIKELGWKPRGGEFLFPTGRLKSFLKELNQIPWDGIILSGGWLKIAPFIKTQAVVSLFAGSDLTILPNFRHIIMKRYSCFFFKNIAIKFFQILGAVLQRRGIKRSTFINFYPEGIDPEGDSIISSLMGNRKFERLQMRGFDLAGYQYKPPSNRVGAEVKTFCAQRFIWKKPFPAGYTVGEDKGNDKMLHGIAEFYEKTKIPLQVNLVEKGINVNETKDLAISLGISHLIRWHKEMTNVDIQKFYEDSDIIFDQFGNHLIGRGAIDAMLIGRPVIGNARNDVFERVLGESMPMCDANTSKQISQWLELLVFDSKKREDIGKKSRNFIIKHFDGRSTANAILEHILGKIHINDK